MRRCAVLALVGSLAACNVAPAPPPAAAAEAPDPWANPKPPPPSPLIHADAPALPYLALPNPPAPAEPSPRAYGPAPRPPGLHAIVAPPNETTRALAVLPDGTAAVSADVTGSVRLWPTLDGSREPVVVPMHRPVALAMMRSGANVEIAGLDGAGQLELVTATGLGELPASTQVALPRPAIGVWATTKGFLVETDDQRLVFVTPGWPPSTDVEPPPGTHIAAIAVHGDAMLALLAGSEGVHARWLLADKGLHWGDQSPALKIEPGPIALSPGHTQIAATNLEHDLVTIDLATGKLTARAPDTDSNNEFSTTDMAPIGYLDDTSVLVHFTGFTTLWHIDAASFTDMAQDRRGSVAAIGRSHAVFGEGAELMIADAAGTPHYLGFRIGALTMFAPAGRTLLATDGQQLVRLGADLRDHASYDLPSPHGTGYSVITLLDASHVLLQSYQREAYYDIVALDTMDATPVSTSERLVTYDLATRTAAFTDGAKLSFRRFDAATVTFGKAATLEAPNVSSVTFDGTTAVVGWLRPDDVFVQQKVTHIRPDAGTLVPGRAVEQMVQRGGGEEDMPIEPSPPVFARSVKSPDGALAASIANGRMSLRDAAGSVRWTVPAAGASDVVWLRSGELLATGAGVARVDLETGAFSDRRCGWQFGVWTDSVSQFASTMMCEAE